MGTTTGGFVDSSKTCKFIVNFTLISTLQIRYASGATQDAIVKSYDAGGFTLTWTKTGLPTGTGNLIFLCFR